LSVCEQNYTGTQGELLNRF